MWAGATVRDLPASSTSDDLVDAGLLARLTAPLPPFPRCFSNALKKSSQADGVTLITDHTCKLPATKDIPWLYHITLLLDSLAL